MDVNEMDVNMKEILEDEFNDDPLRKEISIHHLDDALFTEEILSMHPETSYSTTEASNIIKRSDSTIRNYFRTELIDYINAERHGKFYRLDYKSVFKIHMILTLIEKTQKATADISYILGNTGRITLGKSQYNKKNEVQTDNMSNQISDNEIQNIKKLMVQQQIDSQLLREESRVNQLVVEKLSIEKDIQSLELADMQDNQKISEEKYYRVLDYSLKNTIGKKKEPQSFLSQLFKNNNKDEVDVEEVLSGARDQLVEDEKYKNVRNERRKKVQELEQKKIELDQQIQTQKEAIEQLSNKLAEYRKISSTNDLVENLEN